MDKKKKKKRVSRVIKGDWPDNKIRQLISLVELRSELWDAGRTNYRIPKPQVWQEVALELGDSFQWHDCRTKWQNLRVTYKSNLAKLEKTNKQKNAADEATNVHWRFFEVMRFIGRSGSQQSADSISNLNVNDCSMSLEMDCSDASCSTPTLQQNVDCSQSTSNVDKHKLRSSTSGTPTPPPSVSSSSIGDIAAQVLQVMNRNNEHAAFGDYITAELRSLPAERAFALKRRLNRTLLDFWDEMEVIL